MVPAPYPIVSIAAQVSGMEAQETIGDVYRAREDVLVDVERQ